MRAIEEDPEHSGASCAAHTSNRGISLDDRPTELFDLMSQIRQTDTLDPTITGTAVTQLADNQTDASTEVVIDIDRERRAVAGANVTSIVRLEGESEAFVMDVPGNSTSTASASEIPAAAETASTGPAASVPQSHEAPAPAPAPAAAPAEESRGFWGGLFKTIGDAITAGPASLYSKATEAVSGALGSAWEWCKSTTVGGFLCGIAEDLGLKDLVCGIASFASKTVECALRVVEMPGRLLNALVTNDWDQLKKAGQDLMNTAGQALNGIGQAASGLFFGALEIIGVMDVIRGSGKIFEVLKDGLSGKGWDWGKLGSGLLELGIGVLSLYLTAQALVDGGAGLALMQGVKAVAKSGLKVACKEGAEILAKECAKEIAESATKSLIKEGAQIAGKELIEKGAKELVEKAAQNGLQLTIQEATELATKEFIQNSAKAAAEKMAKEAMERTGAQLGKEALEQISKEAAEKVNRELIERVGRECGEKAAKEFGEECAKIGAKNLTGESVEQVSKKAVSKAAEEGMERAGVRSVTADATEAMLKKIQNSSVDDLAKELMEKGGKELAESEARKMAKALKSMEKEFGQWCNKGLEANFKKSLEDTITKQVVKEMEENGFKQAMKSAYQAGVERELKNLGLHEAAVKELTERAMGTFDDAFEKGVRENVRKGVEEGCERFRKRRLRLDEGDDVAVVNRYYGNAISELDSVKITYLQRAALVEVAVLKSVGKSLDEELDSPPTALTSLAQPEAEGKEGGEEGDEPFVFASSGKSKGG